MGSNATAHFGYGFPVPGCEEDSEFREAWEEEDHDDELARRLGWEKVAWAPDKPFKPRWEGEPVPADYPLVDLEQHERWSASLDKKREMLELVPVEFHEYGVESGGGAWLVIKETAKRCDWGEYETIDKATVDSLRQALTWKVQLRTHCELMGIPWAEPRWFMTAVYW